MAREAFPSEQTTASVGSGRLQDDCFRADQRKLRHDEALAILKDRIQPMTAREPVRTLMSAGRVLAAGCIAPRAIPAYVNAAVDGYAFQANEKTRNTAARLRVEGRAAAGHPYDRSCAPGSAVRIYTGAVMPDGADTVVMQEDITPSRDTIADGSSVNAASDVFITVPAGLKAGANVRKAGEDAAAGATLFGVGHVVRPQDIAMLSAVGLAEVACYARVRVGIVSTGDEVVEAGQAELRPGQVYDANAGMLAALLRAAGADVEMLGIWPDQRETVTARLGEAAVRFDVVVTSGGASLGGEDHMAAALDTLGQRHLWQLAIKPGRPMMFGQIATGDRDTVVVGLPGNPVAVFVCSLMYVMPMVRVLGGAAWRDPRRFMLPAAFAFSGRKRGRREFWRGMIVDLNGQMAADKFARDGSGLITGLTAADGLIDIAEDHGDVAVGDLVPFIPLTEFGIA